MNTYNILKPFEKEIISQSTLEKKISENRIVILQGKKTSVLSGEGLTLKINASVGLNSLEGFDTEYKKIQAIKNHPNHPDIMMDLSTQQIPSPLYSIIADEIGCPVGSIPYYTCFNGKCGIQKNELIETIEKQAESGISFMTLHLTANLKLAEQARMRRIPIISRGGSLILRDMKINNRAENILLNCLDDILSICQKHHVVINIGTTFRPSTLIDAMDAVNLQELELQKAMGVLLINRGIHVQMEGIGHIPFLKIPEYVKCLRKDEYIPFMPLGPIVSDRTQGYDHITAAVGASYMGALGGADIINAVTREEHTGGIPVLDSILEAIDVAHTVAKIVNDVRFPKAYASAKFKCNNCMGIPMENGCSRCENECPFIWNNNCF